MFSTADYITGVDTIKTKTKIVSKSGLGNAFFKNLFVNSPMM